MALHTRLSNYVQNPLFKQPKSQRRLAKFIPFVAKAQQSKVIITAVISNQRKQPELPVFFETRSNILKDGPQAIIFRIWKLNPTTTTISALLVA